MIDAARPLPLPVVAGPRVIVSWLVSLEKEYAAALAEFTRPECDRFAFVKGFLSARGLGYGLIPAGEDRFVHVVVPGNGPLRPIQSRPIFTAHVDRSPGSPGANDNSAAVLQLLFFAARSPGCEALFTDSEESRGEPSPRAQGSFRLAETLKKKNFGSRVFYSLDMCGRGDTVVLSEAGERLLERRKKTRTELYRKLRGLRLRLLELLAPAFGGGLQSLPTPFSDNLGFLLQGFPAVQFTLLPRSEASAYEREHKKILSDLAGVPRRSAGDAAAYKARFDAIQPETWRLRHTERDAVESLSPQAFTLMLKLLHELNRLGVPEV
jgi:hypothetical protein